ncbi:MAG: ribonuclease III [Candidatus Dojkabacteria bacterium]|nr:ribonuclease III [Candidatus Dojkabacteria bacterium]
MEINYLVHEQINRIVGYNIQNIDIFIKALTHVSVSRKHNNEKLEFLGDAVIELVTTEYLYINFSNYSEGFLTTVRSALVKTESLATECKRIGLNALIIMSESEDKSGGREKKHILANVFEAIVGAIYVDNKYEIDRCKVFVINNLLYKTDIIIKNKYNYDPKTVLQEKFQEIFKETPKYELVEAIGPDHKKRFKMKLILNGQYICEGSGYSKQEAEQKAAQIALENWNKVLEKLINQKI